MKQVDARAPPSASASLVAARLLLREHRQTSAGRSQMYCTSTYLATAIRIDTTCAYAVSDVRGILRIICRFAPPSAFTSPTRHSRGHDAGQEQGSAQAAQRRGRTDERCSLVHFRGGGRVSVWDQGLAGGSEFVLDDVLRPDSSQQEAFAHVHELLQSVVDGQVLAPLSPYLSLSPLLLFPVGACVCISPAVEHASGI